MRTVLAIDPGSAKCGLAVVSEAGVLKHEIVQRDDLLPAVKTCAAEYKLDVILLGNGTCSKSITQVLADGLVLVPVKVVEEAFSSVKARNRFWDENPPKGLRRLLPRGMLYPERPWDDYVAVILAEEFLTSESNL